MKPQDLRIGNWVKCKTADGEKFGKICDILDLGYFAARCNDVEYRGKFHNVVGVMDCVSPIPITDELLLKIGFKKNSFGWWRLDKRNDKFMIKRYSQLSTIEYWNEVHNPEDVTETNYGSTIELPYKINLHTLQNIWHLLTGEELEIKL